MKEYTVEFIVLVGEGAGHEHKTISIKINAEDTESALVIAKSMLSIEIQFKGECGYLAPNAEKLHKYEIDYDDSNPCNDCELSSCVGCAHSETNDDWEDYD